MKLSLPNAIAGVYLLIKELYKRTYIFETANVNSNDIIKLTIGKTKINSIVFVLEYPFKYNKYKSLRFLFKNDIKITK